ncbi:MAG: SDR family oxidoreductase [Deltaproteobacteria bacterium]|nr:SDR family oxidoreductase [Deltaproteobacteria bacterium]MBW2397024.1 SDR family oxidoreductase [Deltaproteobacteria bacterium]
MGLRGLEGLPVLVTGAASGIGRAIALRLSDEGAVVGIFDLDGSGAEVTVAAIAEAGGRGHAWQVDITDGPGVEAAVEAFEAELGPVAGLVNNAGWDEAAPFLETDVTLWRKVIDINLYGPLHVTQAVLRRMTHHGRGRVVSISSDAGRVGSSGEAVYAACKGGIAAFSKSVARELAKQGITLNVVAPGPTDTPFFASFDESGKLAAALARSIPMRRLGQPEDCPGLVAFLLSDDAAFITGQTISVSGGLTMHG